MDFQEQRDITLETWFRVWGSGFGVSGLAFRGLGGSGFRVWGIRHQAAKRPNPKALGLKIRSALGDQGLWGLGVRLRALASGRDCTKLALHKLVGRGWVRIDLGFHTIPFE